MNNFSKAIVLSILAIAAQSVCSQSLLKTYQDYISRFSSTAVEQQKLHGIPASITLAQGILESAAGTSQLAAESNNHFGIKCGNNWTGRKAYSDDETKGECFRAYDNVMQSYEDHAQFLLTRQRYASLFSLKVTDYKGWAHGLKAAGYATDPNYPNKLIKIIEDYKLYELDRGVKAPKDNVAPTAKDKDTQTAVAAGKNTTASHSKTGKNSGSAAGRTKISVSHQHTAYRNNAVKCVIATAGDSYSSIALEMGILERNILKYNDVTEDRQLEEGEIVYLSHKRNHSLTQKSHVVAAGESAWSIAQQYGVTVQAIYDLNNKKYDKGVEINERLYLKPQKKSKK